MRTTRFVLLVLFLGIPALAGGMMIEGASKILTPTVESSANLPSLGIPLTPQTLTYPFVMFPYRNTTHVYEMIVRLSTLDIFASSNRINVTIQVAVTNPQDVKSIITMFVPATFDVNSINSSNFPLFVTLNLNAGNAFPLYNITSLSTGTFKIYPTASGQWTVFSVVFLQNGKFEYVTAQGSAFAIQPYSDLLQIHSNRALLEGVQAETKAIASQGRSAEIVEGLTWFVSGLTLLQLYSLAFPIIHKVYIKLKDSETAGKKSG